jgi:hypothetical protein
MLRRYLRLACFSASILACHASVWAWGHPGHQLVGSLADELLAGSTASKKVASILGPKVKTLQTAATWPDCVRDVNRLANGTFHYDKFSKYHSPVCGPFEGGAEQLRMEDYVKRNWTNCPGGGGKAPSECHRQYHFADIAVQHDDYSRAWHGSSERDIVSVIQAAIGVLRGGPPVTAPFSIKDKKEALLMLAHFVGDLHQPLHVGALYLGADGSLINPDSAATPLTPSMETRGGNKLEIGSTSCMPTGTTFQLHSLCRVWPPGRVKSGVRP